MDNQKVDISVELSGSVEDVIYKNADNGYTVINLGCDEGLIAVVGNLGDVNEGERLSLRGGWITSPKYGRQFKAAMCERSMPETESEISAYLGSGVIKGLGPAIAKKIVKQFGTEALDIIDNDCMQLTVIKGITSDKALYISNEYHKITGVNEVIKFLGEYNFGPAHAISVWSAFEHDSIKQIKTNPYILCTSGIDIDFRSVDRMAADLGFDAENSDRVRAGIVYVLHENANAGHTCLPTEKLRESVCDNLGIERRQFESCLDDCEEKDWVVRITLGKREFVYLPEYYLAETYIAKKLAFMLRTSAQYEKDYSDEIRGVEFSENIQYEDLQRAAISACLTGSVFILTGGPGTGKTTTLNGVIKILKAQKKRILLCAPTGRAAKRMSDLTGEPARTIHRLLEVDFTAKGELKFKRNETNPLPADVVIADEMSMVDALLMCSLVRAIKPTSKFIMVGDSNQLPSVGAGNVLKDLIASHYIPSVELKEIFRQAAQSLIVTNAHRIVNGEFPVLDDRQNDFFFMNKSLESDIAELVIQLAKQRLPDTYGFSPIDDIQVLCPTKMGMAGTKELNKQLQSALNPPSQNKAELKFFDVIFRTGDKVMQTKNDYDVLWTKNNEKGSGIFNGDIGIIRSVDRFSQNVTIDFEGRVAIYTSEMLRRLEHAYAITIHKSQGSEYDAVIIPITAFTHNLLYRNLLYTGVTRAKKMIIVIGTKELVKTMVDNNRKMLRYSLLRPLLEIEMNRKVIVMLDFGAKVTVVAEDICDELRKLTIDDIASKDKKGSYTANKENNQTDPDAANKENNQPDSDAADRITIIKRRFDRKDCDGMEMVIAATDDNALNHEIAEYCKANGIMVNAVDQKADCSFIFPSYIKEKNLVAAFSSGGNSPVLTQYLKGKEQEILTPFLGELNEYMGQIREKVIAQYDTQAERKRVFKEILCAAIDNGRIPEI